MRVLLVEGRVGESEAAERMLRQAGHEVSRCVDAGAGSFPCNGMLHGDCPIEDQVIDAAVLVRTDLADIRTPREDGARCALRRNVPLVLTGDVDNSPYAEWATGRVAEVADLPAALERATDAVLARHTEAARRSLRAVLVAHDLDPSGATAEVHRDGTQLLVFLRPSVSIPKQVSEMAAVRAAGAVRDVDPYASKVDVTVEGVGAEHLV